MKPPTIFAVCAALFLSSCASLTTDGGKDLAAPVAAIATAAVIQKADLADRAGAAEKMIRVATVLEDAVSADGLTGADIAALITEVVGNEAEWGGYAIAIGLLFDRYTVKLGEGQAAVIIRDIATGIRSVAQPYL